MGDTWEIHGRYMGNKWEINGRYMGNKWEIHGRYMGDTWEMIHGRYMRNTWEIHEIGDPKSTPGDQTYMHTSIGSGTPDSSPLATRM